MKGEKVMKIKKTLCIILALLLILGLTPGSAYAKKFTTGKDEPYVYTAEDRAELDRQIFSRISDVVETGIRQTTVNNRNTTTPASVSKEQQRETERLKQQGKCPICKGIGKTADGRYDCAACHGTGKYQEENKKAE